MEKELTATNDDISKREEALFYVCTEGPGSGMSGCSPLFMLHPTHSRNVGSLPRFSGV